MLEFSEKVQRFQEIQQEIESLTDEALGIVKTHCSSEELASAKAYWHAQIKIVVSDNTEYLGGSMHSMDESLKELEARQALASLERSRSKETRLRKAKPKWTKPKGTRSKETRSEWAKSKETRSEWAKSKGHIVFNEDFEFFHMPDGDVFRVEKEAQMTAEGYRVGSKFYCTEMSWDIMSKDSQYDID